MNFTKKHPRSWFSVNCYFGLLEISPVFLIKQNQIYPVFYTQSIVDVCIRRRKFDSVHIHSDRNHFALIRTSIHDFVFDEVFGLSNVFGACSEVLFPYEAYLHTFNFEFYEMEIYLSDNHIFQMIELSLPFKIDVETIFNTNFHFHRCNLGFLYVIIWKQNSEVDFLSKCSFHVSC